jgi:MoxR-like ATPase
VGSVTCIPLFLQAVPGSGKTEGVRLLNIHRTFGSYVLEKKRLQFAEGPLVLAVREGHISLPDESNLLRSNAMMILLPVLGTRPGDCFTHPDVRAKITITPGFVLVTTGNDLAERGRVRVPNLVM